MIRTSIEADTKALGAHVEKKRAAVRRAPGEIARDLVVVIEGAIEDSIYDAGIFDTGRLAGSVVPFPVTEIKGQATAGAEATHPAAVAINRGRRPGVLPDVRELIAWGERHNVNPMAAAIHISREGIKGRRFMDNAKRRVKRAIKPATDKKVRKIAENK